MGRDVSTTVFSGCGYTNVLICLESVSGLEVLGGYQKASTPQGPAKDLEDGHQRGKLLLTEHVHQLNVINLIVRRSDA